MHPSGERGILGSHAGAVAPGDPHPLWGAEQGARLRGHSHSLTSCLEEARPRLISLSPSSAHRTSAHQRRGRQPRDDRSRFHMPRSSAQFRATSVSHWATIAGNANNAPLDKLQIATAAKPHKTANLTQPLRPCFLRLDTSASILGAASVRLASQPFVAWRRQPQTDSSPSLGDVCRRALIMPPGARADRLG